MSCQRLVSGGAVTSLPWAGPESTYQASSPGGAKSPAAVRLDLPVSPSLPTSHTPGDLRPLHTLGFSRSTGPWVSV